MQITIGHYHLNPGGVTRIIESQVKSLVMMNPDIRIRIICGGWSEKSFRFSENAEPIIYPELNYLENKSYHAGDLEERFKRIASILKDEVAKCDVLHFHNATLGKNPLISIALYLLAKQGQTIINHAHDFAEDRPANIEFMTQVIENHFKLNTSEVMYPDFDNYLFGVINSSDEKRVLSYGFCAGRLFKWLNPASIPELPENSSMQRSRENLIKALNLDKEKRIISYPVRVIRRKNIGEFLLLAWYFKDDASWLVTQPPNNPVEKTFYNEWVLFAKQAGIDVVFEAGQKADFVDVMMGSDLCITTSIMEGFGMVFVEPWFWGTPVKGRSIPAVMNDLTGSGVDFPHLYKHVNVTVNQEVVDFGFLDDLEQQKIIIELICAGKDALKKLNPELDNMLSEVPSALIRKNKIALTKNLSEENYGRKLFELYQTIS